jgi:hypothetical protein
MTRDLVSLSWPVPQRVCSTTSRSCLEAFNFGQLALPQFWRRQFTCCKMAEDISLPGLSWDPVTDSISNNRPRKRTRYSPIASSDPPLFSSDDDPSADNYTQDRHKKIFRGPWYHHHRIPDSEYSIRDPKKSKRTFERQYDSGVWLGSDGTDTDDAIENLESVSCASTNLPLRPSGEMPARQNLTPSPEELAQRQIDLCLETGNETIDLS